VKFHVRSMRIGVAILAGLGAFLLFSVGPFTGVAAPRYSEWSAPMNLGPVVNSTDADFAPHISKDGRSLYFASTRTNPNGGEDLWVSRRPDKDTPWGAPMNLGSTVNSASNDRSPALSRDGHLLFFASDRPGGSGVLDIWVSWRAHTHDDLGWQPPVNLAAVNSSATDAGPSYFENEDLGIPQLFMASSMPGGSGGLDLYVSTLTSGGWWSAPIPIPELNSGQLDLTPTIRHDGLEIIFASNRPTSGAQDLWVATRGSVNDLWSVPLNLGLTVNSAANENFPCLSSDGKSLFFNSSRAGGFGPSDLYVSTRSK
jgi:WD40-like Beta Propeller Repeat